MTANQSGKPASTVVDCSQATRTPPGVGDAFKGRVANSDYAFSERIPDGLTGWTGVAPGAPFHGFTIFLDSQQRACIVLEVHVRVDDDVAPAVPAWATTVSLGKQSASQSVEEGRVGDSSVTNVSTSFSFKRAHRTDDGQLLLVAPTASLQAARAAYDALIKSLKVGEP